MSNTGIVAGKYILINTTNRNLQVFHGRREIKSFNLQWGKGMISLGQYKVTSKTYNATGNNELKLSSTDGSLSLSIFGKKMPTTGKILKGSKLLWLDNDDLVELFTLISIGTPVAITAEVPVEPPHPPIEKQPINQPLAIEPSSEILVEQTITEIPTEPTEQKEELCPPPEQAEQLLTSEKPIEMEPPVEQETSQQHHTATEPSQLPPAGFYYTVIPGDSLWRIARKFNLPMQLIMVKNSLDNPNRIYPGQQIFIPYRG